jgi:prepilin-type N-terminal cleavage/methylation domain-containing protein
MIPGPIGTPARSRSESGFTLVEMMVAMAIMGIVVTAFLAILASVQRGLVRETNRSSTLDQARLAMEALDREVRSASIVTVPTSGSSAYYLLTLYGPNSFTTSYSTSGTCPTGANSNWWVQYRVQSQELQRREYVSSWSPWRTVASGIVNTGTTTNVPFSPETAGQYTSSNGAPRLVTIVFLVKTQTSDTTYTTATLRSSLAIRNQDPSLSCSVPPG